MRHAAALLLLAALAVAGSRGECPPKDFDALEEFDIQEYISAPWYVQKQVPLAYQPRDQLYCVRARYSPLDPEDLTKGLKVDNDANQGEVNGAVVGGGALGGVFPLVATLPDPERSAKLKVGPRVPFLPGTVQLGRGDYWVVAAGTLGGGGGGEGGGAASADGGGSAVRYDWAIVTGGPPKRETDDGCATGSSWRLFRERWQVNGVGFWLFSRTPVDPAGTELMLAAAQELGLDVSELVAVQQQGCEYREE